MWTNIIAGTILAIATGVYMVWFFDGLIKSVTSEDEENIAFGIKYS